MLPCFLTKILFKEKSAEPDQIQLVLLWKKKRSKLYWKDNMGQTVLSFDQNLLERLKNATSIEKNNYVKDNMSQIVFPQIQFLKCTWNRK